MQNLYAMRKRFTTLTYYLYKSPKTDEDDTINNSNHSSVLPHCRLVTATGAIIALEAVAQTRVVVAQTATRALSARLVTVTALRIHA
jgi:hypothetical protein